MGLLVATKDDIGATMSEMLYGSNIRVPGELFDKSIYISLVRPFAAFNHSSDHSIIFQDLKSCSKIVLMDSIKKQYQQAFEGPFDVRKRFKNIF